MFPQLKLIIWLPFCQKNVFRISGFEFQIYISKLVCCIKVPSFEAYLFLPCSYTAFENFSCNFLQQMEPILKRLESIDSKVSALNERDIENQRLLARLRQVETNFKLLYHTSRSEIANLKRNLRKDSR